MRAVALSAAILLAGCSDPHDCSLPAFVDEYAGAAALDDCGSPTSEGPGPVDPAGYQAAQSCVLDHVQRQAPFRVQWTLQGVEGPNKGAYIGASRDGHWTLSWFMQLAAPTGMLPPTTRFTCTDLQARSGTATDTYLGLECVGRVTAEQCMP